MHANHGTMDKRAKLSCSQIYKLKYDTKDKLGEKKNGCLLWLYFEILISTHTKIRVTEKTEYLTFCIMFPFYNEFS